MIQLQTILLSIPLGLALSALARSQQSESSSHSAADASPQQQSQERALAPRLLSHQEKYTAPSTPEERLDLLDIVLLASVDGRFHAVNRTTADTLWTMDDPTVTSPASQELLYSLVRTNHPRIRADLDAPPQYDEVDEEIPETYIIEPQSGIIFVNPPAAYRDDPLQRLPFDVPQLVEMSPFKYDDFHTFVAKKSSAFISLDLKTGKILEILDPDKCDWREAPRYDHANNPLGSAEEELLDDLEQEQGSSRHPQKLEVHIGRTDYHVTVYSRGRIIQNLTFSSYGPNKADKAKQDLWRRTPDNNYFQSLPNGNLVQLKAGQDQPVRKFVDFKRPVVAVFDILMNPDTQTPLALLQPSPSLPDLYSAASLTPSHLAQLTEFTKQELTYVGRIGNSLYAMSHINFPLVSFSEYTETSPKRRTIEAGGSADGEDETEDGSENNDGTVCTDLDCFTGIHYSQHAHRSWMSRLITNGSQEPKQQPPFSSSVPPLQSSTTILMLPEAPTKSTTVSSPHVEHPSDSSSDQRHSPIPPALPPTPAPSFWDITAGTRSVLTALASVLVVMLAIFFKKIRSTKWNSDSPKRQLAELPIAPQWNPYSTINSATPRPALEKDLPPIPKDSPHASPNLLAVPPTSLSLPEIPQLPVAAALPANPSAPTLPVNTQPPTTATPAPTPTNIPPPNGATNDDAAPDGDSDGEDAGPGNGGAFKKRRRKRGRGGKKTVVIDPGAKADDPPESEDQQNTNGSTDGKASSDSYVIVTQPKKEAPAFSSSLMVSDTVLGYGSHGTVVYKGSFQGRDVAVKRLLNDFVTLAIREVTLLQESDDHPNVIRYYFKESKDNFLYIALELCPASLADLVERAGAPDIRELVASFDPKRALAQVTAGLRHLHGMKIVHRDIKPQNILISKPVSAVRGASGGMGSKAASYRMLISDFGLCRKLDSDQTSFLPTHVGAAGAGTVGWRAPEILRGEVKLDEQTGDSASTGGLGSGTPNSSVGGTGRPGGNTTHRLTKAVDIFALGCLFYYTLTGGEHPFGDRYERESNILKSQMNLSWLERLGEEGVEADDLIAKMLDSDPKKRPDTTQILLHPFFWTPARRLAFLQDASDRFEIMERDPKEHPLITLETQASSVVGPDWSKRLDKLFLDNLGKFRKYDTKSVQDLLRAFRNKKHHYQDMPESLKRMMGPLPHGFLAYFTKRFPRLFMHVYYVIALDPLLRSEPMFRSYFELADSD